MRVYVDMVGNLFHVGHVRLLKRARELGGRPEHTTLVVGVHDDEAVQAYKRCPTIPHAQRVEMLESCRYVDQVIPHAPLHITEAYLGQHQIDVVVHAHAADDTRYHDMYRVPIQLGKFRRLEYTPGVSTTAIMQRLHAADAAK